MTVPNGNRAAAADHDGPSTPRFHVKRCRADIGCSTPDPGPGTTSRSSHFYPLDQSQDVFTRDPV